MAVNRNFAAIQPAGTMLSYALCSLFKIGATGFEPATSRPPAVRATKLRHTPLFGTFFIIAEDLLLVKNFFKKREQSILQYVAVIKKY